MCRLNLNSWRQCDSDDDDAWWEGGGSLWRCSRGVIVGGLCSLPSTYGVVVPYIVNTRTLVENNYVD